MPAAQRPNLDQHRWHLTRLGMRDVHAHLAVQLHQLIRKALWQHAPTDASQVRLVVIKRRVDHQLGNLTTFQGL